MPGKQPKQLRRPGVDHAGRTPLHYAALDGDTVLVRELLNSGMEASTADDNGWTPLHFAAQSQWKEIVEILIQAGSPIDPRDMQGNTPLSKAVFNSKGAGDVILLLLASGADPYAQNAYGISPLKLARTIANFDVRQFFCAFPQNDHIV